MAAVASSICLTCLIDVQSTQGKSAQLKGVCIFTRLCYCWLARRRWRCYVKVKGGSRHRAIGNGRMRNAEEGKVSCATFPVIEGLASIRLGKGWRCKLRTSGTWRASHERHFFLRNDTEQGKQSHNEGHFETEDASSSEDELRHRQHSKNCSQFRQQTESLTWCFIWQEDEDEGYLSGEKVTRKARQVHCHWWCIHDERGDLTRATCPLIKAPLYWVTNRRRTCRKPITAHTHWPWPCKAVHSGLALSDSHSKCSFLPSSTPASARGWGTRCWPSRLVSDHRSLHSFVTLPSSPPLCLHSTAWTLLIGRGQAFELWTSDIATHTRTMAMVVECNEVCSKCGKWQSSKSIGQLDANSATCWFNCEWFRQAQMSQAWREKLP